MAISPINISRVSLGLQSNFALDSLRHNQVAVFLSEARIATGRSFVAASEDPAAALRAADLGQELSHHQQSLSNLQFADNTLAAADSAINNVNELLIEAHTIASQNVGNLTTADEREATAELIAGIREQLQVIGNRQFDGRYLFAGRDTLEQPFIDALGGIAYVGDAGEIVTRISDDLDAAISIPGSALFGALSGRVGAAADLSPVLADSTRLDDLEGATGLGVQPGTLVFQEAGGAGLFTVNLETADTIGDVVTLINQAAAAAGSSLTASLSTTGLVITPGGTAVSIGDAGAGAIARNLGILTGQATSSPVLGEDLGQRLARLTPVEDLAAGAGVDLAGGLIITNGDQSVTIDLSAAETAGDMINVINNSGLFVFARINDAGTGLEIVNQVSGTLLSIGENGGTTASDLGIRTLDLQTPLDSLNFGEGVGRIEGEDDLRVTATDGSTFDVNLDGAQTIGDVIDLINTASADAGIAVSASLASIGNGIRLVDSTGGTGDLSIGGLNLSDAAGDLGLLQSVSGGATELVGDDTNPTRTEGILDVLMELERALRADDTLGITLAGTRLEEFMEEMTRVHGVVGARSQAMQAKYVEMEDAAATTQIFLSQVRDLDYAEAVTQLQMAQIQLQASLQTSSILLSMSLLDFLG